MGCGSLMEHMEQRKCIWTLSGMSLPSTGFIQADCLLAFLVTSIVELGFSSFVGHVGQRKCVWTLQGMPSPSLASIRVDRFVSFLSSSIVKVGFGSFEDHGGRMKRIWTPQGVQPDVIQADSCFISWLPLFLRLDSVPSWNAVGRHCVPNDKETFDSLAFASALAGNGSSMFVTGRRLPPVMEGCSTAPPICLLQQAAGPLPFTTGRHSPSMMGGWWTPPTPCLFMASHQQFLSHSLLFIGHVYDLVILNLQRLLHILLIRRVTLRVITFQCRVCNWTNLYSQRLLHTLTILLSVSLILHLSLLLVDARLLIGNGR